MGFMSPGPATLNEWSVIAGGRGCFHLGELVQGFISGNRWDRERSWSKSGIKALNPLCQIKNMLTSSSQNKVWALRSESLWEVREGLVQEAWSLWNAIWESLGIHSTHIYGAPSTQRRLGPVPHLKE